MEQNKVSFLNPLTGEPLSQQEIDEMFMRRCLQLAKNGRQNAKPNPMVGAVIVSEEGRIIGEGYHVRCERAGASDAGVDVSYNDPGDGQYGNYGKPAFETVQGQIRKLLPAKRRCVQYSGVCGQVLKPFVFRTFIL